MRQLFLFLSFFSLLAVQRADACGYNFTSQCGTLLELNSNSQLIPFYVGPCTWMTNFQGYSFGTVTNLTLGKESVYTWESCTNSILSMKLRYRIYANGATPGAFSEYTIPLFSTTQAGDYRNRVFQGDASTDLLAGLSSGVSYNLEVYYLGQVDFDGNGSADGTLLNDNAGLFYKATFTKSGAVGGLSISFPTKINVSCPGGGDGKLTAAATGGTSPYTYSWSNGATGATAMNLAAGAYTVTATATGGATGTAVTSVTAPPAISITINSTDATSASANNGSATAAPSGGNGAPYTYIWSTGATTAGITGLGPGTYTVTVADNKPCSAVKSVTIIVSGSIPTGYCAVNGSLPWSEWIGEVILGTLDNTSSKTSYSNFTTVSAPALNIGDVYPLSIKSGLSWYGSPEFFRAWIDFNRNGVFDATELVLDQSVNPPVQGLSQVIGNQSFTVPASATEGTTRMRVALKKGAAPGPCENFAAGEVEDYHVNLVAPTGSCNLTAAVSNLLCNNNGTNANPADDTYTFSLTVTGVGTGTGWTTTINGTNFTGTYGTAKALGPYLISAGNLVFSVKDNATLTCTRNVLVTPPGTCSTAVPCSISAVVGNVQCDNNGTTGVTSDDKFTFNLTVSGTGTGAGWSSTVNGTAQTGTYGTAKTLGPYLISGGTLNFTVIDGTASTCTASASLIPPAPCSSGGGPSYCTSQSAFPWHEWISKVQFGGISNPSQKWVYTDFTALTASVVRGTAVPITASISYSWDNFPDFVRCWIDYNGDGIFTEPGEIAFSSPVNATPLGVQDFPVNATVNIPATATPGVTRMRISLKRTAYATPCEASIPMGEVEDYSVNIAASAGPGDAGSRSSQLKIAARNLPSGNAIQAAWSTSEPVNNIRLERAEAPDFQWNTVQEWQDFYLPKTETTLLHLLDEHPAEGFNHYRLVFGLSNREVVFSNVETVDNRVLPDFVVYPNPSLPGQPVTLNLEEWLGNELQIQVIHATGRQVFAQKIDRLETPELELPTANFSNGEYFIVLQSPHFRPVTRRLIVLQE